MWRIFRDIGGFIGWMAIKHGRSELELEQSIEKRERNIIVSTVVLPVLTYLSINLNQKPATRIVGKLKI